jgi:hypothetical protein
MADAMQADVFDLARDMAAKRDPEIESVDQMPVIFCIIEDLKHTLTTATETAFFETVDAATHEKTQELAPVEHSPRPWQCAPGGSTLPIPR